jgi:hypothetical protein
MSNGGDASTKQSEAEPVTSAPPVDTGMSDGSAAPTKLSQAEPVAWIASIINSIKTLVLALIALALAFDWVSWSNQQNAAVLGVVAAGFVLISSLATAFLRQKVTPVASPRAADGTPLVRKS